MGLFDGKTVIVTGGGKATLKDGAAGSIGYGIDIAFAKEGANLVITGRNVAKLEDAKESLEAEYGIKVLPVQADVSAGQDNEAVVQNVIDKAIEEFGRIDAVVNNAQASASGVTIADHTMDQFNLAIYSGLYATYLYMQKAYPHLKETKGSVVNFASGAGLFGNFGQCSYAAAKEGIRGLSRVAANEWGPDGINVNVVCPLAWTAQLENFEAAYPEAFKANVHMPPAGHYGDVEKEIGRVVVQLCGPDFKYMNGETVTLEGGMGQRPKADICSRCLIAGGLRVCAGPIFDVRLSFCVPFVWVWHTGHVSPWLVFIVVRAAMGYAVEWSVLISATSCRKALI